MCLYVIRPFPKKYSIVFFLYNYIKRKGVPANSEIKRHILIDLPLDDQKTRTGVETKWDLPRLQGQKK